MPTVFNFLSKCKILSALLISHGASIIGCSTLAVGLASVSCGGLYAQDVSRSKVIIHNRILTTVNDKTITTLDVVKQLDLLLYRNYPELRGQPEGRLQFYQAFWMRVLKDMIDKELVLADAQEKQFDVTTGDVREEMEELFGPDVIKNVHAAGLTVSDAQKMIRSDIILRRMLYFRVKSRAYSSVSPQDIEKAYNKLTQDTEGRKQISWRAVSFKSGDEVQAKQVAFKAYQLFKSGDANPENIKQELQKRGVLLADGGRTSVVVSSVFTNYPSELSDEMAAHIMSVDAGGYAEPMFQIGRNDPTPTWKVYLVIDKKAGDLPSLSDLEPKIREELTQEKIEVLSDQYITNLRAHFGIDFKELERELRGYQPFG